MWRYRKTDARETSEFAWPKSAFTIEMALASAADLTLPPSLLPHRIHRAPRSVRNPQRHSHHHRAADHVIPEPGNIRKPGRGEDRRLARQHPAEHRSEERRVGKECRS